MIHWSSKPIERDKGLVADFCPVCRSPRPFQLIRIGQAAAFGEGVLAGFELNCTVCQMRFSVDPARYLDVEQDSARGLSDLIPKTFPKLLETYAARLQLEEQIKRTPAPLPQETKEYLLLEPFHLLNHMVENRFSRRGEFDKASGVGCLVTIFLTIGMIIGSMYAPRGLTAQRVVSLAFTLFIVGTLYTIIQLHLAPRRHFRLAVVPLLARALEPLEPTEADLERSISKCRLLGLKIGYLLRVADLWTELRKRVATHETH